MIESGHTYHIAGNIVKNKIFTGKLCRLLAGAAKRCHMPKFAEKTFANSHKTVKFLSKVSLFLKFCIKLDYRYV